jgi:hypothetical protein
MLPHGQLEDRSSLLDIVPLRQLYTRSHYTLQLVHATLGYKINLGLTSIGGFLRGGKNASLNWGHVLELLQTIYVLNDLFYYLEWLISSAPSSSAGSSLSRQPKF